MSFFNNMSLKRRLIASFSFVLFVPTLIIVIISYNNTKQAIAEEQLAGAQESLSLLNNNMTTVIEPKLEQTDFLATYITTTKLTTNEQMIRTLFDEYLAMNTDVAIAYVGTEDGKMVRQPYFEYAADYDPRERPWYKQAVSQKGQVIITDPYISTSSGELVVTIAKQLEDGSGVYGMDLSIQTIVDIANSITIGDDGFITVIDNINHYISKPNTKSGIEANEPYVETLTTIGASTETDGHVIIYTENELTGWKLYGNLIKAEAVKTAQASFSTYLMILVLCFAVGSVLVYFIIRSIMKPIHHLIEAATQISNGNLSNPITITENNEIGQLGQAFEEMRQNLATLVSDVDKNANHVTISAKDLTENATQTIAATELATAAVQTIAGTLDLQMVANEKNAQTIYEMEQNIATIAANNQEVTALSQEAAANAEIGGQSVEKTVQQMHAITHSVTAADDTVQALSSRIHEIDAIVDVINSIADQTNLLALNASIEAARAGVHGQGFTVVAQEVRKLAESSQASTKQISELITGIQRDTDASVSFMKSVKSDVTEGLSLTEETASQFTKIVESLQQITPMMEHISTNTQSLATSAEQATMSANELSGQSQQNAAALEEIAATTEQIHHSMEEIGAASGTLQQFAADLHQKVRRFTV
ncbi:MAG: methyl-accepting chemotaxis protein [Solibacillus sp.]